MGAAATHHPRLTPLDRQLSSEVHESRRIRRVACELERREHLRDLQLDRVLSRHRLIDLLCVRH